MDTVWNELRAVVWLVSMITVTLTPSGYPF